MNTARDLDNDAIARLQPLMAEVAAAREAAHAAAATDDGAPFSAYVAAMVRLNTAIAAEFSG